MEYRIAKDKMEPPFFWVEKSVNGEWQRVFGTTGATAEESWGMLERLREEGIIWID